MISRLVKPAATVTIPDINKIHWPVMLGNPTFVFDSAQFRVYQNQTSRAQDRHHPSVTEADIPIAMPWIPLDQSALKMAPSFHHPGQEVGSAWIKSWIKSYRDPQTIWRSRQVRFRSGEFCAVLKALFERHFEPGEQLQWIQVVDNGEGVYFVQTRHHIAVFDVRQPADMNDEVLTASAKRKFIACRFHITVGQTKSLANLA